MRTLAMIRVLLFWPIFIMFFVSCASNGPRSYSLPQPSLPIPGKILTKSMIRTYNFSENDLKNVRFYLGDDLELRGAKASYYKEPAYPALNLTTVRETKTISFSAGTPGSLIDIDTLFGINGRYLRIKVGFGTDGHNFNELILSFSPNLSGRYTLDHRWIFNKVRLNGQNQNYNCVSGCWNNYLRIAVRERIINKPSRSQASGRRGTVYTGRGGWP